MSFDLALIEQPGFLLHNKQLLDVIAENPFVNVRQQNMLSLPSINVTSFRIRSHQLFLLLPRLFVIFSLLCSIGSKANRVFDFILARCRLLEFRIDSRLVSMYARSFRFASISSSITVNCAEPAMSLTSKTSSAAVFRFS